MLSKKTLALSSRARKEMLDWDRFDARLLPKVERLLEEICTTPFAGTGKPEALKHNLSGWWSRRINKEHRLVYQVRGNMVYVLSCRFHYE